VTPPADPLEVLPASFTYAAALEVGVSKHQLRRLLEAGELTRLGRGVYRSASAEPAEEDLIEIALRARDATLCLTSALSRHDLTDLIPRAIDVALPRTRRQPQLTAPVRWHRFADETFALGRDEMVVEPGTTMGLYSPERCIVDAFRLRHLEGPELGIEALRRWLRRRGATPAKLLSFAQAFPPAHSAIAKTLRVLL